MLSTGPLCRDLVGYCMPSTWWQCELAHRKIRKCYSFLYYQGRGKMLYQPWETCQVQRIGAKLFLNIETATTSQSAHLIIVHLYGEEFKSKKKFNLETPSPPHLYPSPKQAWLHRRCPFWKHSAPISTNHARPALLDLSAEHFKCKRVDRVPTLILFWSLAIGKSKWTV